MNELALKFLGPLKLLAREVVHEPGDDPIDGIHDMAADYIAEREVDKFDPFDQDLMDRIEAAATQLAEYFVWSMEKRTSI